MTSRNRSYGLASRTLRNLDFIIHAAADAANLVHPVTQLTNSLLALVVYAKEDSNVWSRMKISTTELVKDGWPVWHEPIRQLATLKELIKNLRHAVAHRGVMFSSDSKVLAEVNVSFTNRSWRGEINAASLNLFVRRLVEFVEQSGVTVPPSHEGHRDESDVVGLDRSILFVCAGNTCRSVIAEALARRRFGATTRVTSRGLRPQVPLDAQHALEALQRAGIELTTHVPRGVEDVDLSTFDYVIAMNPSVAFELAQRAGAKVIIAWNVADPWDARNPDAYDACVSAIEEWIHVGLP